MAGGLRPVESNSPRWMQVSGMKFCSWIGCRAYFEFRIGGSVSDSLPKMPMSARRFIYTFPYASAAIRATTNFWRLL